MPDVGRCEFGVLLEWERRGMLRPSVLAWLSSRGFCRTPKCRTWLFVLEEFPYVPREWLQGEVGHVIKAISASGQAQHS